MSRLDRAVIEEFIASNPLDAIIERRCRLGAANGKGVRAGPCLCEPTKGKTPLWVNTQTNRFGCLKGDCKGDIFSYFQQFEGHDFRQTLALLGGEEVASDPDALAARQAEREKEAAARARRRAALDEEERRKAFEIWERGRPAAGTLVEAYWTHRRLQLTDTPALRFSAEETYWFTEGDKPDPIYVGPCMLAAIQAGDGRFLGVHRTWLDPRLGTAAMPPFGEASGKADIRTPAGEPAGNTKKMRGLKKGGAIRLTRPPAEGRAILVMGEGIETTATVYRALCSHGRAGPGGYQAWAAGDLGNIAGGALGLSSPHPEKANRSVPSAEPDLKDPGVMPPDWAESVILLGDGDSDPHVTRALLERGKRRFEAAGVPTVTRFAEPGRDFNDMARGE